MNGVLLRRLGIEGGEAKLVAWAGASLALLGWADVSVQNAAETFFLKRVGVEYLPVAFLVSSLLMVGSTYGVGRLIARRDRPGLLPGVFAVLALALVPVWLLARFDAPGAFWLVILFSKQIQAVALLVFWLAMGDLLHARQAKRLFAPLMGGFTLGAIVGSFASDPIGRAVGIDGLLVFSAAVLAAGALVTLPLRGMRLPRLDRGLGAEAVGSPLPGPVADPAAYREEVSALGRMWRESGLFRLLLIASVCSGLLGPMLYFQFSYVADLATQGQGGEHQLLALYAQIRGWLNLGVLVTQLAITSALYRHIGVPLSAALSPLIYFLGFVGLSVQLSLPAGIAAMAAARLQDHAIHDPALRVLFNLFPERLRSRATALLEGPAKRIGGTLGNVLVLSALALGTARWVGFAALPIAALWIAAAAVLWRTYPRLLLAASARTARAADAASFEAMLDPHTLRLLSGQLRAADPERCRAAIELVSDAPRELAVEALALAARKAPDATRHLLVQALDRQLEQSVREPVQSPAAAGAVRTLLQTAVDLGDRDRADLVQAYGRLTARSEANERDARVFERALRDASPAVRLAALAALHGSTSATADAPLLDDALAAAVRGADPAARRTAREELRALLLCSQPDSLWQRRLHLLAELLALPAERVETAEAIAAVAAHHGAHAAAAAEAMRPLRDDSDERVRAAILHFVGHARIREEAEWLVAHVGSRAPAIGAAARDGLLAGGSMAASALMVEHCFGKRSTRDAILSIVRELEVDADTLRELYQRELDWIRGTLLSAHALSGRTTPAMILQRLAERMDEGLHTALLFLTAIHDEDRFAELDDLMRHTQGERQHAILLEALEAFLSPREKDELVPLFDAQSLDVKARAAAAKSRTAIPSFEDATRALFDDPDDLTREIAQATLPKAAALAPAPCIDEDGAVLSPIEIALQIRAIPFFERLTTRQLVDLAQVAREETYSADAVICRQGDDGSCMYFVVEGEVAVRQDTGLLATLGPGAFFGEMAIFESSTRSATVLATRPARLIRIERHDLLALIDEIPAIAVGILQALSRRLRDTNVRV